MDDELFQEYLAEVFESLDTLDEQFVKLEKSPSDVKIVDAIFRPVHSIKGSSAFFNLDHVTGFAHKLENLLDDIRKDKRDATPKVIDGLLKGTDYIKDIFNRLSGGDMSHELLPDEKLFIDNLEENISDVAVAEGPKTFNFHLKNMDDALTSLKNAGKSDEALLGKIRSSLNVIKAIASDSANIIQMGDVDGLLDEETNIPQVGKLGDILVELGEVKRDEVEDAIANKTDEETVGDALINQGVATEEQVGKALDKQKMEKQEQKVAHMASNVHKTMRIDQEKVDGFMDQIGELVIISEVFNYLEKRLTSLGGVDADAISKEFKIANMNFSELTLHLQEGLSEVRKVAVKGLFQKIPRIVRDIATALGKDVEVVTEGEDIMIDKSLAEKLESPIIHMIRNSVDHGIEMPEKRANNGKPERGTVTVSASIDGETLKLILLDDGGGIPRNIIAKKAVDKGIVSEAEVGRMLDSDVFNFIFSPGFSTAEKVTDISGRGVGMDVVKRAITESKGKIHIESKLGKYTKITVSVPVSTTLVTITGLVTAVGDRKFIFPVEDVLESLRPDDKEIFVIKDSLNMVNIRGNIYPLVKLSDRFGIKSKITKPTDGVCLIISKHGKQSCVLTDQIVEQQNVVLKDLGEIFHAVKSIMGGAILGDGSIGLVMDVEGLMESR